MEALFWTLCFLVVYPYALYPLAIRVANRLTARRPHEGSPGFAPRVTIVLPVHNEAGRIEAKIANTLALEYPRESLRIIVVGDGCTDDSLERAARAGGDSVEVVALPERSGKAAALNLGIERARGDVVVFTDASISLEREALRRLVEHFDDPTISCVSGEDYVTGAESEGMYGRIELMLRREEATLHSIAGASGCFYAQRRGSLETFREGMAPDFLSVLVAVKNGGRAIAEPQARGFMQATAGNSSEFARKVRTFLRGMTALAANAQLLNPLRYPVFAFILWSHKVLRWFGPLAMIGSYALALAMSSEPLYLVLFLLQTTFYALALIGLAWPQVAARSAAVRLPAFFVLVNVAALKAFWLWLSGVRVEIWQPTRRPG